MIRNVMPFHLRTGTRVKGEVGLDVTGPVAGRRPRLRWKRGITVREIRDSRFH